MEMKFYKKFLFMLMITCLFCSISSISFADNTTSSAITTSSSSITINDDRGEERAKPAPIIAPNNDLVEKEDKKEDKKEEAGDPQAPIDYPKITDPETPTSIGPVTSDDSNKAGNKAIVDLNIPSPAIPAGLPKTSESDPFRNYVLSVISLSAAYFLLRKQ